MAHFPIMERGGAVVCIGTTSMVAGLMADVDENQFGPSLWRSVGGTGA